MTRMSDYKPLVRQRYFTAIDWAGYWDAHYIAALRRGSIWTIVEKYRAERDRRLAEAIAWASK